MSLETPLITRGELALKLRRSERTLYRWDAFLAPAVLRVEHTVLYNFPAVLEILHKRANQQKQAKQKDRKV